MDEGDGDTMQYRLKSGQINYESVSERGAYYCVVIRDGAFHNLSEDQRLDLIKHLENAAPKKDDGLIDLEDMF